MSEADLDSKDGSGMPVIIDPEYSRFIVVARLAAQENGYALAVHGSQTRDLDLIAIPWIEKCSTPEDLIEKVEYRSECKTNGHPVSVREHGRLSLVFMIGGSFGDPRYVDFSIIPPKRSTPDQVSEPEDSGVDQFLDELAEECTCCPDCQNVPCEGLMAGGPCDNWCNCDD